MKNKSMQRESSEEKNLQSEEVLSNNQPKEPKNKTSSRYPRGIPFILMFKFGERYSFYTYYVILTLYLSEELNFSENISKVIFHTFMMLVYTMPILGAKMADASITKFWTILYMAILYISGKIFVLIGSSLMVVEYMWAMSLLGLFMIAIAEGALKPCSSTFGGDQFKDDQHKQRKRYYALYFFVIYCSHFLAALLAPILRADVRCSGKDFCFPLAFGIAAIISFLGTVVFIIGKPFYIITSVQEGILDKVCKCIGYAWIEKIKNKDGKKGHWLDYAEGQFDESLISDLKTLLHVLQVFIPLPIFFTLLHQLGSSWVLQARKMDQEFGAYRIKPDQMTILQPILMSIIVPILELAVYPCLYKVGLLRSPLQKIGTACFLIAMAFFIAGFVQLRIEADIPTQPARGFGEIMIINNSPCHIKVTGDDKLTLPKFESIAVKDLPLNKNRSWQLIASGCGILDLNRAGEFSFNNSQFLAILLTKKIQSLGFYHTTDKRIKLKNSNPQVKLFYRLTGRNNTIILQGPKKYTFPSTEYISVADDYVELEPGTYEILFEKLNGKNRTLTTSQRFRNGGSYIFSIYHNLAENITTSFVTTTVKWNSVHIFYQLPQHIFMATAEVMFAITGVSFAYAETPVSLESVVHGCWFLIFAFGNALLLIFQSFIHLLKDSLGFFIYGILMFFGLGIFMALSMFYTYIHEENKNAELKSKESVAKNEENKNAKLKTKGSLSKNEL